MRNGTALKVKYILERMNALEVENSGRPNDPKKVEMKRIYRDTQALINHLYHECVIHEQECKRCTKVDIVPRFKNEEEITEYLKTHKDVISYRSGADTIVTYRGTLFPFIDEQGYIILVKKEDREDD